MFVDLFIKCLRFLNDISGLLGVLVAVVAAGFAYKQIHTWKDEAGGLAKYEVAIKYRLSLLSLEDAISDLRYPVTRADEIKELEEHYNFDESDSEFPESGWSKEQWALYRKKSNVRWLKNKFETEKRLSYVRWQKMMVKYQAFRDLLPEAQVHSIIDSRSTKDLDEFLSRVFYMYELHHAKLFDEWQDYKLESNAKTPDDFKLPSSVDSLKKTLSESGQMPHVDWSVKSEHASDHDRFETDLRNEIDRFESPAKKYMGKYGKE